MSHFPKSGSCGIMRTAMKDFSALEIKLGISFTDKQLLMQAFLHRSYLNENSGVGMGHNERLEFLGDAVLELVITEALFYEFPEKTEGELTDIRSALVRGRNLAEIAHRLHFFHAIQVSRGEFNAK